VYTNPEAQRTAVAEFTRFCNYRRHHEGTGNVAAAVYFGWRDEILKQREAQEDATMYPRFRQTLSRSWGQPPGELGSGL
jgi:hypothetical protein